MRRRIPLVALALTLGMAGSARAATTTGSGTASMTLSTICVIWADTRTLDFGAQAPTTTQITQTDAQITNSGIQCTNGGTANVYATSANASGSQFRMKTSGNSYLNYDIYQDAGRATQWPQSSTAPGSAVTGSGGTQTYYVYGRIPAQVYGAPGAYSDTITLTVSY